MILSAPSVPTPTNARAGSSLAAAASSVQAVAACLLAVLLLAPSGTDVTKLIQLLIAALRSYQHTEQQTSLLH